MLQSFTLNWESICQQFLTSFTFCIRKYILIQQYFIYDTVMVNQNNLMVNMSSYHATDIEFHSKLHKDESTFCHTGVYKTSNFFGSKTLAYPCYIVCLSWTYANSSCGANIKKTQLDRIDQHL